MDVRDGFLDAIGNTPLIRLRRASEETGCEILGKAEFLNPGSSVKDRAALFIVRDAEERGMLRPGGVIVEGTAGNTGIGLALVGNARGYRTVIVIPDTQSREKIDMLRLCGAEVPAGAGRPLPRSQQLREGVRPARRGAGEQRAERRDLGQSVRQRRQPARTLRRPPARRSGGRPTARSTPSSAPSAPAARSPGVGMFLKERNPNVVIGLADPPGAALYSYYTTGELKMEGESISEGIGQSRITANLEGAPIDHAYQIPDAEALPIVFDLLKHEGLCLGSSSGVNVAGAIRLARDLGPGHVIVTILADYGTRYQSKLFNPEFLRSRALPVPDWLE